MKEKWINLTKLNKIGIILLISTLLLMILGLILIGTAKTKIISVFLVINGFDILKKTSIWEVLTHNAEESGWLIVNGSKVSWIQLQLGCVLSVIITPILFATTIGLFGYSFYLNKYKK